MVYIARGTFADGHAATTVPDGQGVSVPGVIAASVWAIGLLIGLIALGTGHDLVAVPALSLAIMSPWFGLAWVARAQRQVAAAEQWSVSEQGTSYAGGWPATPVIAR